MVRRNTLVPGSVRATYNPQKKRLSLYAEGRVNEYIYDIAFNRVNWMGGLKFNLEGWHGGLLSENDKPYTCEQPVWVDLSAQVFPTKSVTVATANYPEGEIIPVYWTGLIVDDFRDG